MSLPKGAKSAKHCTVLESYGMNLASFPSKIFAICTAPRNHTNFCLPVPPTTRCSIAILRKPYIKPERSADRLGKRVQGTGLPPKDDVA